MTDDDAKIIARDAYSLFAQWLELKEPERAALLSRIQNEKPHIHRRLMELVRADGDADRASFLSGDAISDAAGAVEAPEAREDRAGQRIGNWRLERSLGAGGMGQVWLAHRGDGMHEGNAAIKMLHFVAADTRANKRFAQEGQILARLTHPHIAMLLDAGFTGDGQRYLVLEYIDGDRIDRWCDQRHLDLQARLKLFLQICDAVSYAHANLIVHRDLKPSNILVLNDGTVKLLDFGIAKLIESESAVVTQMTAEPGSAMTPGYAAPEQVSGGTITTATDIYALGVIFYALLGGRGPYGRDSQSPLQLARAVTEREPDRLSDVTASDNAKDIAAARDTTAERLHRALRGDLETIASKALKKNPAERYNSVRAFADDVQRHLDHKPISARADSTIYRLRKLVRRHWFGVGATALIVVAVAAGVAGTLMKQREAEREAQRAVAVKRFLLDMFEQARTSVQSGGMQVREATVNDMLTAGADHVQKSFASQPEIRDEVYEVLASLYSDAFDPKVSIALERRRLNDAKTAFGADDVRSVPAQIGLANALLTSGDEPEAKQLLTHAQTVLDREGDTTSLVRARLLRWQGILVLLDGTKPPWQEHPLRRSITLLRDRYPDDDDELIEALVTLPSEACRYGRTDEAVSIADELFARTVARYGSDNLFVDTANLLHGQLLVAGGHVVEGIPPLEKAMAGFRRHVGDKNQNVLLAQLDLTEAYWQTGRKDESRALFAAAEEAAKRDHPGEKQVEAMIKTTRNNLAKLEAGKPLRPCDPET